MIRIQVTEPDGRQTTIEIPLTNEARREGVESVPEPEKKAKTISELTDEDYEDEDWIRPKAEKPAETGRRKRLTPEERAKVIELIELGTPKTQIAKLVGCSYATVLKIAKEAEA